MSTKKIFVIVGSILALLIGIGIPWYLFFQSPAPSSALPDLPTHVTIEEGSSLDAISVQLEEKGVVRSAWGFRVYARFSGKSRLLKAGTYVMPRNLSLHELVARLASGEGSSDDIQVTVPEGFNNTQVFNAMYKAGLPFTHEEFDAVVSSGYVGEKNDIIYDGKPEEVDLIGYLFPDTYKFYADGMAEEAVEKMVDNLRVKITPEMRTQIEASNYSFYELLTLASIVEKEVRTYEERRTAAGVFLQRLEDNYPLESDATINFVTGKKDTRPSADDLQVNSLYNSYARAGLPPTPICNPGIDSIKAVLDPVESDYYFFLTTPEGTAVFSKTYEEHLQQKAIYYP